MRALLLLISLAWMAGCRTPQAALREASATRTSLGTFEVHFDLPDRGSAQDVRLALQRATPGLARWGRFEVPVSVHILSDHEALEQAVDREGYGWLRAWGRYDEVFIQSPATWGLLGASQESVDELVLHELAHCLMYQLAADRLGWTRKEIPLWFREGMASFTAGQAYRWPALETLARVLRAHPGVDILGASEALYRGRSEWVYGAAHHAFTFLIERYGTGSVNLVLRAMRSGETFPGAFEQAVGLSAEAFLRDFHRYVRWGGFRGGPPAPVNPTP